MPRYRKLHTSTIDSLDIDAMPDDFHRLTWVLLPLILCRDGRGMYYPTWLRSKLYPLRSDVTDSMVTNVFAWYERRGMIVSYEVDGRRYFYIPTWQKFQGITTKESESPYPEPLQSSARQAPDLLQTNSIQTPPLVNIESESKDESASESKDEHPVEDDFDKMQRLFESILGLLTQQSDINSITECVKLEVTEDDIRGALKWRMDTGLKPVKTISQLVPGCIANRNMRIQKNGAKITKPASEKYKLPDDDEYEYEEQEDVPEIDTKWRTFIEEYVTSRHWQNLLEFGGYDDAGKVIVKVPEAEMAEAKDRFGSTLHRYFMGEYILEGVAI